MMPNAKARGSGDRSVVGDDSRAERVLPLLATKASWLLSSYGDPVWKVRNGRGQTNSIHFDSLLPDGSRLHDPVNERLCATIRRVIFEMRTGPLASTNESAVQYAAAADLRLLVAWMQLNGVFRFSHLSAEDVEQYVKDRAQGKERCLHIPARIEAALGRYENRPAELPSRLALFEMAGIDGRDRNLPEAMRLIDAFRVRHGLGIEITKRAGKGRRKEGLTESALRTICGNIKRLWSLGSRLEGDKLDFDPFPDAGKGIITVLGRQGGRTLTSPTIQTMVLIDRACRWVLDIGPKLLKLRSDLEKFDGQFPPWMKNRERAEEVWALQHEVLRGFNAEVVGLGFPVNMVRSHHSREIGSEIQLRKAVNGFLPTACAIIIAAFTARRHKEVLTLEEGAISGNTAEGHWLLSYIEKTLRRVDATPCPAIVAHAVDLLDKWSARAREGTGKTELFRVPVSEQSSSEDLNFKLELHLNDFAQFVEVPLLPDHSAWHFAPHQFRRFFAILYVWRFEYGDLGALSHHLRHFNIEMTRRYVTDIEMGRVIHEERRSYTVDKMLAIAHGDSKPNGAMGKRLQRHVERLRRSVEISSDRDLPRKIERLVETLGLTLRGTPWGYCGSRNTEPSRRRANCQKPEWKGRSLTSDGFPDTGGSTEATCAGCIHNMVDHIRRPRWEDELRRIEAALANPSLSISVAAAMEERRVMLEGYIEGVVEGT